MLIVLILIRKIMRLTEANRRLHQAANPPRDPRILSQSSSAALEQRQQAEQKAVDQAIAAAVVEEFEQQDAEQKEEKQPAVPFQAIEAERRRAFQKTVPFSNDLIETNQQSSLRKVPTELIQNIYSHFERIKHAGLATLDRKTGALFQPSFRRARLQQLLQHIVC